MRDVKKVINEVEVEEMARQVSIGSQSFENLREKGCFILFGIGGRQRIRSH